MMISEAKMKMVIENYFRSECDINSTIHDAFEKGFRLGVKKAQSAQPEIVRCKHCKHNPSETWFECPLAMFNENQRPETAWCWKGERRDDG